MESFISSLGWNKVFEGKWINTRHSAFSLSCKLQKVTNLNNNDTYIYIVRISGYNITVSRLYKGARLNPPQFVSKLLWRGLFSACGCVCRCGTTLKIPRYKVRGAPMSVFRESNVKLVRFWRWRSGWSAYKRGQDGDVKGIENALFKTPHSLMQWLCVFV